MKKKHVPVRTCIGCRETSAKRALIRIVRTPTGEVLVDPTGKKSGRGAYVCPSSECLKAGIVEKRLEQALKCQLGPGDVESLLYQLAQMLSARKEQP